MLSSECRQNDDIGRQNDVVRMYTYVWRLYIGRQHIHICGALQYAWMVSLAVLMQSGARRRLHQHCRALYVRHHNEYNVGRENAHIRYPPRRLPVCRAPECTRCRTSECARCRAREYAYVISLAALCTHRYIRISHTTVHTATHCNIHCNTRKRRVLQCVLQCGAVFDMVCCGVHCSVVQCVL